MLRVLLHCLASKGDQAAQLCGTSLQRPKCDPPAQSEACMEGITHRYDSHAVMRRNATGWQAVAPGQVCQGRYP